MNFLGPYPITTYSIEESIAAITIASMFDGSLYEAEALDEAAGGILQKLGLEAHKTKGLIGYIKSFTTGIGKIVIAALKGDKEKVKEIASTVKKEDVIDFLLKLDMATLHLVSGPIHTIDAITGWHLWAAVKSVAAKAGSVYDEIKKAIDVIKQKITTLIDKPKREQMLKPISDLELALGDE